MPNDKPETLAYNNVVRGLDLAQGFKMSIPYAQL